MSYSPRFKCKSEAQKRAIRAYYARKRNAQPSPSGVTERLYFKRKNRQQYRKILGPRKEARERYWKVMAEDFPKDFLSDNEWDYIEALAHCPVK